jgi:hypothetical protein
MIKIDARAEWIPTSEDGRRQIVALPGTSKGDGIKIGRLAAIQADAGEKLNISATEEMVPYHRRPASRAVAEYPVGPVRPDRERRRDPVRFGSRPPAVSSS